MLSGSGPIAYDPLSQCLKWLVEIVMMALDCGDSAEAEKRRELLVARTVLDEMKQLLAEQHLTDSPPGRLQNAFKLFEKCACCTEDVAVEPHGVSLRLIHLAAMLSCLTVQCCDTAGALHTT